MPDLFQDFIVTLVALGALITVLRRVFAFFRPRPRAVQAAPMRFISSKEAQRLAGSTKPSARTPKTSS